MFNPIEQSPIKFEDIKLIIWDLDDTFWAGTLSEEGIQWNEAHAQLVISLAKIGIISSICSNNYPQPVLDLLKNHNMEQYFVFSQISWDRKSLLISELIERIQLQSQNILFIDNEIKNLAEVAYSCQGIQVAKPDIIDEIIQFIQNKPDSDPELKRLQHYQVLEKKSVQRQASLQEGVSEYAFLKSCEIEITHITNLTLHSDRIHELINRTNQLNFTKKRLEYQEVLQLISDSSIHKGCFHVKDKFGDYGLVGFYSYSQSEEEQLEHFLFSCRIINSGIVEWVFHFLQKPDIACDSSQTLYLIMSHKPTWITEKSKGEVAVKNYSSNLKPIVRGGCLLDTLLPFLETFLNCKVASDIGQWSSHSCSLAMALDSSPAQLLKLRQLGENLGESNFPSRVLFKDVYHLYILEWSKDYRCGLYQFAEDKYLPIAPVGYDLTQSENREKIKLWKKKAHQLFPGPWNSPIYSKQGLDYLEKQTRYITRTQRRELFLKHVDGMLQEILNINPEAKIVFILSSSRIPENLKDCWIHVPQEINSLNQLLIQFAFEYPENVHIIESEAFISQWLKSHQISPFLDQTPFLLQPAIIRAMTKKIVQFVQQSR